MDMYITTVDKKYMCWAIVHGNLFSSSSLSPKNNLCTFRDVSILKKGGAHKLNQEEFYIIRDFSTAW